MRKLKKPLIIAVAVLVLLLSGALPAFAQVREPDILTLNTIEVYRHLLEDDDQLYVITSVIEYGTNPPYPVDQTYIVRLMNGAVELGATTLYPYHDNGYDYGICSIYFNAADAPAWNGAYTVDIIGNPSLQWLDDTAGTAMAGAVAYDLTLDTYTDETFAANNAAANDMTLTPLALPVVDDAYYFGSDGMFDILSINVGQVNSWTGTYTWEYWDGDEWATPDGLADDTVGFSVAGINDVTFDCPTDWQPTTIDGLTQYWARFRVVTVTATGVNPALGTQSWTNTLTPPPSTDSNTITWHADVSMADAQERLTLRIRYLAQTTETDWGGGADLIYTVTGVRKLTAEGEEYFTNAIVNLRDICPDLFSDIITTPEFPERVFVDDFYTQGEDKDYDIYGANDIYAQTFTPDANYDQTGFQVKIYVVGVPGNIVGSLRNTAAGLPAGADLITGILDDDDVTTDAFGDYYVISFTDEVALTSGTVYAVVITVAGGGVANYAAWFVDSTGTYADGQACFFNGAIWAALAGEDFMFVIYGSGSGGWMQSYRNRLAGQHVGTWLDTTVLAGYFGFSRMWFSTFLWIVLLCLLPSIFAVRAVGSFKVTTLIFALMLPFGALAGFIYLEVAIIAAFFFALVGIYSLFYRSAP